MTHKLRELDVKMGPDRVAKAEDRAKEMTEQLDNTDWIEKAAEEFEKAWKPKRFYRTRRFFRFLWQRLTRGWDDKDTWGLDHTLAGMILPRLCRFKELTNGFPISLTKAKWDEKLDEMIYSFEMLSDYFWDDEMDIEERKETRKRINKGLRTFANWYSALWW